MLSSESLIQEARERGMPGVKMRGILREYLQVLLLTELYGLKGGSRLHFTGGTSLRLVENLGRFSEDLDFNTWNTGKETFEGMIRGTIKGMERRGFTVGAGFEHRGHLSVARLSFPGLEKYYGIDPVRARAGGLMIKMETNRPVWKRDAEPKIVAGFGETVPAPCTPLPVLMADKIDAIIRKNMGRHLYDLAVLLGRKISVDTLVWRKLGGEGDPLNHLLERIKDLPAAELKRMAESLRPFLFDEREAKLVSDAGVIFPELVRQARLGNDRLMANGNAGGGGQRKL